MSIAFSSEARYYCGIIQNALFAECTQQRGIKIENKKPLFYTRGFKNKPISDLFRVILHWMQYYWLDINDL